MAGVIVLNPGLVDSNGNAIATTYSERDGYSLLTQATVIQPTGTNLHTVVDGYVTVAQATGTSLHTTVDGYVAVVQPTGTSLHMVLDSGTSIAQTQIRNASNVLTDVGYATGDAYMPVSVQGTVPVTGAFYPATQPISGSVTSTSETQVQNAAGAWTNVGYQTGDAYMPVSVQGTVKLAVEAIEIGTVDQGTGGSSAWLVTSNNQVQNAAGAWTNVGYQTGDAYVPVNVQNTVTVLQPTGTNLHTTIDGYAVVQQLTASNLNATVVQATGTNLHTVVDGYVTVAQATGTSLHTVVDSGAIGNQVRNASNVWTDVGYNTGDAYMPVTVESVLGNVTVIQPTGTNLHTTIDGYAVVQQLTAANLNATVVQATGTNLHTVVDGYVTVAQATGTSLHTVVDSGAIGNQVRNASNVWTDVGYNTGDAYMPVNVQNTVPVTGAFYPATQPVSGTVTTNNQVQNAAGTWTNVGYQTGDAYVPVSIQNTLTANGLADVQVRNASNTWTDVGYYSGDAYLPVNVQNTVPVTGTFWQATQPISGSVTSTSNTQVQNAAGSWINVGYQTGDAYLPVSVQNTVPVTGTFYQATQPVSGTVSGDIQVQNAAGTWTNVGYQTGDAYMPVNVQNTVPVTGTFWQTTQPVSGTVTSNNQVQNSAGTWTNVGYQTGDAYVPVNIQNTVPISGSITANGLADVQVRNASNTWTDVGYYAGDAYLPVSIQGSVPVTGTFWQTTQPVSGTFWQTTQPVSGTFWQATQPVSGTVTGDMQVQNAAGTWTNVGYQTGDAYVPVNVQGTVPVSGAVTVSQATGTNLHAVLDTGSTTAVTQATGTNLHTVVDSGTITSITNAVAVTGTFWQATQPVSGTFWQATQPVSGTVTGDMQVRNASNAWTDVGYYSGDAYVPVNVQGWLGSTAPTVGQKTMANSIPVTLASDQGSQTVSQATGTNLHTVVDSGTITTITNAVAVTGTFWQATQPVSATALPLPNGAATSALQITQDGYLSTIATNTPALGQAAMAASSPVVIASNQTAVPVSGTFWQTTQPVSGTVTAAQATAANLNATVVGTEGNNTGLPGTNNLGVIPAVAKATAPTYTDGYAVALSTDLAGNLRVVGGNGTQVRNASNTWTDVGYYTGDAYMPVQEQAPIVNIQTTGTITSGSGASSYVAFAAQGYNSGMVVLTGTWAATLVVEFSADGGTTWIQGAFGIPPAVLAPMPLPSLTVTSNGSYQVIGLGAVTNIRVRASAYTSGTANVRIVLAEADPGLFSSFTSIQQNAIVSLFNNTTSNLAANATFTGTSESTLGVAAIQTNFKSDQPCLVQVQQSNDGYYWDIADSWIVAAGLGDGRTIQATASYYRVLVTNTGGSTSTYLRLQTVLCPVAEDIHPARDMCVSGTITALNGTVVLPVHGCGNCALQVTGTWVGTIVGEGSVDGVNWVSVVGYVEPYDRAAISQASVNGVYRVVCSGYGFMRVRASAWTSGTANVFARASVGSALTHSAIIQDVLASTNNSTAANLAAGASFTGTLDFSTGVGAIQISHISDQPCTIQVQQSGDGTNWDISDSFTFEPGTGDSRTVQAVALYFRVIVTNIGAASTTYLRTTTALCPIIEALPRATDDYGNLMVSPALASSSYQPDP